MADITITELANEALESSDVATAADASGDEIINSPDSFLAFRNDEASPKEVTIAKQQDSVRVEGMGDIAISDIVLTIPASTELYLYNCPTRGYNQTNGKLDVTYDGVTDFFVGSFRFARLG